MSLPAITTAIPQRRYQYGEFTLVLLGEIETSDDVAYHYLLGVIPEGKAQPELFVSAEKNPPNQRTEGLYRLRVIAEQISQTLGHSDDWGDIDIFASDALKIVNKMMNLADEKPVLLN